jgi:hypothetical protein
MLPFVNDRDLQETVNNNFTNPSFGTYEASPELITGMTFTGDIGHN